MDFTGEDVDRLATGHNALEDLLKPSLIQARQRITKMEYFPKGRYYNLFRHDYYDSVSFSLNHLKVDVAYQRIHPDYRLDWMYYFDELDKCVHDSIKFHIVMKCWETNEYRVKAIALFALYDDKGNIDHYVGTTCDLTHEVFERQHLIKNKHKSDILNSRYLMSMWSYDPKNKIIHSDNSCNDAIYKDYTYIEFLALVHPDFKKKMSLKFCDMDNYCLELKSFLSYMLHPDGTYHYYQIIPDKLMDNDGNIVNYLFISHDVTEEKMEEFRMRTFAEHVHLMTEESGMRLLYYEPGSHFLYSDDPLAKSDLHKISIDELIKSFPEDTRQNVSDVFADCDERRLKRNEWITRWKPINDDTYHLYRVVVLPVLDEKGFIKVYGFMRIDITKDSVQTEMLDFIQKVSKIGAWTYDLETEKSQWTDEMYNIFGIDPNSGIHLNFRDYKKFIKEEDIDSILQKIHKGLDSMKDFMMEYDIKSCDGKIKHIEHRLHVKRNANGKPISLFGTLMDITERTLLKREKERADQMLSAVLKSLPVMVSIKSISDDYRVVMANEKYASFFGKSTEEIIGLKNQEFVPEAYISKFSASDIKASNNDVNHPLYEIISVLDGEGVTRYFQLTKFIINIKGRKLLICVCSDVTELQLAKDKAEENDRLKSAFLANMSHEIRTPLNAIVGFSDLIANNVSPEENLQFNEIIKSNSAHLLRLIGDILDLSKMEANMMKFIFSKFNVYDLMNEAMLAMYDKFVAKGIKLIYQSVDEEFIVRQDRVRVMEVLNNFLTNAYKNTSAGSVKMWLEKKVGKFRICVKDTGKGISQDKQEIIFERFEKLDNFKEGTGLGLSVSKAIAECLGGSVGVESKVGVGSMFWIELPIKGKQYKQGTNSVIAH